MTVVVAARTKDGVALAADSMTTHGWERVHKDAPKLWTSAGYALGAAGDVRTIQVLRHHVTWPKYRPDEDDDIEAFIVKQVIPAIWTATDAQSCTVTRDGTKHIEASLVFAWGTHLAELCRNGAVLIHTAGRCAIGSGGPEALGALGDGPTWTIKQVAAAARKASELNVYCGPPIVTMTTTDLTPQEAP